MKTIFEGNGAPKLTTILRGVVASKYEGDVLVDVSGQTWLDLTSGLGTAAMVKKVAMVRKDGTELEVNAVSPGTLPRFEALVISTGKVTKDDRGVVMARKGYALIQDSELLGAIWFDACDPSDD